MKLKEKMVAVPIIKHPMVYLLLVLVFLVMLRTPILSVFSRPEMILMIYLGIFLIFSVTVGFKEIGPLYNKGGGIINLIGITGAVYICGILAESFTGYFLSANDPQLLDQYTFHLSGPYVLNQLARYSLVGIGEEIFKLCVFFILYWLGVKVSKHKLGSCIISVIATSFFFGLLHSNYNYDQWLNITLIIGVGALVYFYFLFKYQTIVPLMIAHGLQDFLVSLEHTEELTGIYSLFLVALILIWFIARFGFGIKVNRKMTWSSFFMEIFIHFHCCDLSLI